MEEGYVGYGNGDVDILHYGRFDFFYLYLYFCALRNVDQAAKREKYIVILSRLFLKLGGLIL